MNKKSWYTLVLVGFVFIAMAFSLSACGNKNWELSYLAGAGGTISGTATQTVTEGKNGTAVTAVPDTGYGFVEWSDGVTTATRQDKKVRADISVTAQFAQLFTLTYSADTGGTISGTATQSITEGKNGTAVTAVPDVGYEFVEWSDGVTTATRQDTNITANLSVTAQLIRVEVPVDKLRFTLIDEGSAYSVSGMAETQYKIVRIPSTFNNLPVTNIGESAFEERISLTSIIIPDSVTSIGDFAFYYCTSLTSIIIPDSVTSIGEYAFTYCISLTSIIIPDSVTSVDESVFAGCSGLTSIIIPDSVTSIGGGAFAGCSRLTNVTIGSGVTSIGDYVFAECYKLTEVYNKSELAIVKGSQDHGRVAYYAKNVYTTTGESKLSITDGFVIYTGDDEVILVSYQGAEASITIPNGVTSIGDFAFYFGELEFSGLTSIIIPDSVTSIGKYAFAGCNSLTSVTIGSGVTTIGNYAFAECYKLTEVYNKSELTITAGSEDYGEVAYYAKNVYTPTTGERKLSITDGFVIYTDGDDVILISYQGTEASITIPNGVTSIGGGAFYECSSLTSVTISDSVTIIGDGAFEDCSALTSVTIGSGVTSIGDYAFYDCSGLTNIIIPDSVTSIGNYAFYGCCKLTEVYNKSELAIVKGSQDHGRVAYYAKNVYTTDGGSKLSITADGFVLYTDGDEVILVSYQGAETSMVIPNDVTSIGNYAFYRYSGLTSITIPDSVTSIGKYAFYSCSSLTSITIGSGVTSIGDFAFDECSGLTNITIPNGVTSIGDGAFDECSGLTSIIIPDSVTSIGKSAFYGCNGLTSIIIPASVTNIGNYVFFNCSNLTIYCKAASKPDGWQSDWNNHNRPVVWGWTE